MDALLLEVAVFLTIPQLVHLQVLEVHSHFPFPQSHFVQLHFNVITENHPIGHTPPDDTPGTVYIRNCSFLI